MKNRWDVTDVKARGLAAGGLISISLVAGCGDGVMCGEGTVRKGNTCVAASSMGGGDAGSSSTSAGAGESGGSSTGGGDAGSSSISSTSAGAGESGGSSTGGGDAGSSSISGTSAGAGEGGGSPVDCTDLATRPCYDGPVGTQGVGVCLGGEQTCANGTWGPCVGAVNPSAEMCDGLDNDCDGVADDGDPGGGLACSTGELGVCAAGTTACAGGRVACTRNRGPTRDICGNGFDEDCSGAEDGCAAHDAYVQFVSPYVGLANQPGTLIARGTAFNTAGSMLVAQVGTTEIGPLAPDSATQLTIDYPALPPGRYPVSIKGSSRMPSTNAELVVLEPPAMSAHMIDAPSTRKRLVYDAERQTLYAVNFIDQQIERYQYSGGSWATLSPYTLPLLRDIAMAPDGRSLIALANGAIYDIQLNAPPPFVAVQRAWYPTSHCGTYLFTLAMANDGSAIVAPRMASCSGSLPSSLYNILSYSLTYNSSPELYGGNVGGSLDGSRVYMGGDGLFPADYVYIFDSRTHRISRGPIGATFSSVTVSANASRVILRNTAVYSRDLIRTGDLPAGGVALASRDSSKAFVYRNDGEAPQIVVHDLNGPLMAGDVYPTSSTVDLSASPSTIPGVQYDISMAATPDDAVVFVSGNRGILVVPVE